MTLKTPSIDLARLLDRPVGRGGGLRDPLPGNPRDRYSRDQCLATSVDRSTMALVKKLAAERGLSRGAFVGMIVEAALKMSADDLDDLLAK